jgi:hypothetical protein
MLAGADREKFLKLQALFDSANEGERLAALAAANRILERNKVTWRDLNGHSPVPVSPPQPPPPKAWSPAADAPTEERETLGKDAADRMYLVLQELLSHGLTPWELNFTNDMIAKIEQYEGRSFLSKKQLAVIERMFDQYLSK